MRKALVLAVLAIVMLLPGAAWPEPFRIDAHPVALNPRNPQIRTVGQLSYRGGLALSSPDRRFGGLSDLLVAADGGAFMAVTDTGLWIAARLTHDVQGNLVGAAKAQLVPLLGPGGRRYDKKWRNDAEAMAMAGGRLLVGFEHWHRIWAYPQPGMRGWNSAPVRILTPHTLRRAPQNQGIEAMAVLRGGRMLLLSEGLRAPGDTVRGWIGAPGRWRPVRYRPAPNFRPTGAAALRDGDVLVLERAASLLSGLRARIVRISRAALAADGLLEGVEIARLGPPLATDNFEGIAVRQDGRGNTLIYLVSDDNFSGLQRTLLLMFALRN